MRREEKVPLNENYMEERNAAKNSSLWRERDY
jgi:hypothetical protein